MAALRLLATAILLAAPPAAAIRLYLTDGTYHLVREYEVKSDRVRFYSVERSQWEEIPLELIDLQRTEREIKERAEERKQELQLWETEEQAEREHRRKIARVPREPGVYLLDGSEFRSLPQAELQVKTDKKKEILKIITPIPIVAGKRTVVIDGERSKTVLRTPTPEFYLRLHRQERFAIIRLEPKKGVRHVQEWAVLPVTDEIIEEHSDIEIFRREVGHNLYQIWPKKPLEPGEYAVVEFSLGEANIQAWDFGYWPTESPAGN